MATSQKSQDMGSGSNASIETKLAGIRALFKESGPAAAERATIELLRDEPTSSKAFSALARILARQNRYDDAARAAEKAKGLAPLEIEPLLMLGFIRLRDKDQAKAATAFSEAIALDPSSTRALLGAAVVKMTDDSLEEAEILCQRALDLNPSMDRGHELMARITLRKGNKPEAMEQLKALASRSPGNARATRALVQIMNSEGKKEELLEFLEQDVAADPDDSRRIYRLSRVAASSGRPDIAVEHYRRLAGGNDAKLTDKIRLIAALIENGDLDEAEAKTVDLGTAKVMAPITAKIRGDIALKSGEVGSALSQYKQACIAARVSPLDSAEEVKAKSPEEKAKLWKAHSRLKIVEAAREFRAQKTG